MVEVRRVALPGVGVMHSFATADGVELAVVAHRTGSSDLVVRHGATTSATPSPCASMKTRRTRSPTCSAALASIESIAELDDLPGRADRLVHGRPRRCDRRTDPSASCRAVEGVALVAIVRGDHAHPAPNADFVVHAGDTLVAAGPAQGIDALFRALRDGDGLAERHRSDAGRESRRLMLQMMLRPRWVLALLLALGIAAAFAALGQWQVERAVVQATVESRPTEDVRPFAGLAVPDEPTEQSATGQLVEVSGTFVPGDTVIVEGRLNDGVAGLLAGRAPRGHGWPGGRPARRPRLGRRRAGRADRGRPVRHRHRPRRGRHGDRAIPAERGAGGPRRRRRPLRHDHRRCRAAHQPLERLRRPPGVLRLRDGGRADRRASTRSSSPPPEQSVELNWLNIFYAIEWVVFAGFAVYLWYRLVRDAVEREREEAAEAGEGRTEGAPRQADS